MYKSKLQELCQQRAWNLPVYNTSKQGLDHNPCFSATVTVNGQAFQTLDVSKSSKEAQNDAAKIAFDHFSLPNPSPPIVSSVPNPPKPSIPKPSSFPQPSLPSTSGSSNAITELDSIHATGQTLQPDAQGTLQTPQKNGSSLVANLQVDESRTGVQGDNRIEAEVTAHSSNVQHLYKSQLQNYAQKRNLALPEYASEREGPPHNTRFKCRVTIDGQTFESPTFFSTLKEAENAAAKFALTSLSPNEVQQHDSGFYKNLLQELVQKEGIPLPIYSTSRRGEAHEPIFVSSLEIEGQIFTGEEAKTKKNAEINAAKVAYNALKERKTIEIPILCSTHQGQETSLPVTYCLQSNPSDVQQNDTPQVPIISSSGKVTMEQADDDKGKGSSSLSDIVYGNATSPSIPYEFQNGSSSHLASSSAQLTVDSSPELSAGRSILSYKRVTVYPHGQNMMIPEGSTLLPMSDDNWVAFSHPKQEVFQYPVGAHNVFKVNATSFQNCIVPPPDQALMTGNDTIVLASPGKKWYICGVGKHCETGGQKLAITVQSGAGAPQVAPGPSPEGSY
ncbi:double-stranded RNA-binding protein 1 isoform X1 [Ziziphus jujuba]|uniref:Double-stranded RNA-binding protein 1 isoform X1 n=2 Tax=Ziziphus jujuba TaxID=326968 RepID=A0A6P4BL30_ZIZJJ|nr:double-stranded RNA-binding protein 1 isoform X1 [Ziziphus jujuba]